MTSATQTQLRRGTATQVAAMTPAQGEPVVDTTNNRLIIGDGVTVGGCALPKLSDTLSNFRRAITGTYTVANGDGGYTLALGNAAFYTLTFNAASGYSSNFMVLVVNEDTAAGKSIAPNGVTSFILWPGQCCIIFNDNNVWKVMGAPTRYRLTGLTTFHVSTTGNDSNDGLSSSLATPQAAANLILNSVDLNGQSAVILLGSGTFTGVALSNQWVGAGSVALNGSPGATTISTVSHCVDLSGASLIVKNLELTSTGGGACLHSSYGSFIDIRPGMVFLSTSAQHIALGQGGNVIQNAAYTISGSANYHLYIHEKSQFRGGGAFANILTGALTISPFCFCDEFGEFTGLGVSYGGGAGTNTGTRYVGTNLSIINTLGGGASFFPGTVAGSVDATSLYY